VGVWLCVGQVSMHSSRILSPPLRRKTSSKGDLLPEETLWLDLIDTVVQITRSLSAGLGDMEGKTEIDHDELLFQLRTLVQRSFTALLTATSGPTPSGVDLSFLKILRAFLTRASVSSPNLSDLRAVLASVFSAYAYEESILSLANRLLEKDLFVNVAQATDLRQRGWRPRGSTCEGCGRRVWGPGVSGDIFSKWEEREELDMKRTKERRAEMAGGQVERGKGRAHVRNTSKASIAEIMRNRSKTALIAPVGEGGQENGHQRSDADDAKVELGALVVLACRHIYHEACLEAMQVEDATTDAREFRCPIDG